MLEKVLRQRKCCARERCRIAAVCEAVINCLQMFYFSYILFYKHIHSTESVCIFIGQIQYSANPCSEQWERVPCRKWYGIHFRSLDLRLMCICQLLYDDSHGKLPYSWFAQEAPLIVSCIVACFSVFEDVTNLFGGLKYTNKKLISFTSPSLIKVKSKQFSLLFAMMYFDCIHGCCPEKQTQLQFFSLNLPYNISMLNKNIFADMDGIFDIT